MREKVFFKMGKWSAEFDEVGNCTNVTYDEGYLRLTGISSLNETDLENLWSKIIHPDDLQMFDAFYKDLFLKHPERMDYDLECRILVDSEYRWFHDFGHCTRRADGSVSRVDGVIFDIQDIVDGQNAQKALAQNNVRFFALEDNFEALYDVELDTGHYVSYNRDEFYQRNVSDKVVSATEFFDDLRTNVDRVVYEEDREGVYNVQTREAIVKALAAKDHIDHYYRIVTENGPMWLKMRIVYKDAEKKNIIVGIFNAEEEMASRQQEEKFKQELIQTNARLFALEDNFESLYDVEIDSGHYDVFVKGEFFRDNVLDKLTVPKDYFEELRANIDAVIYPEDRDALFNTLTRESIRNVLAQNEHFDHYYRIITASGAVWFKIRLVYKNSDRKNVIIGVFNASKDVEAKQIAEQKRQLQEALTFTNFFLDTYVSAYYVDLDTLSCKVYKRTNELERGYPIIANYLDSITGYINRDVHPDDRKMLIDAVQPDRMRAELKEKNEYSHILRDHSNGKEKYYRMQVIRGTDENHAAFGFIDITDEVKEQQARHDEADHAKKLIESVAATYSVAYTVNMATNAVQMLKLNKAVFNRLNSFTNFDDAKNALLNILHENDKERMAQELSFDVIREKLSSKESYTIEYRTCIDGVTQWHEMNITSIDRDNVAMGFAEKDLEIIKLHLEAKRFDEYFALYEVDIDTGMLKVVKNDAGYGAIPIGQAAPYTSYFRGMAKLVDTEASISLQMMADLDRIKQELAHEDKRNLTYKSDILQGNKWVDVTMYCILRHEDGTPAMFTLGFALADSRTIERLELQRKQKEDMQMIGGLASGYDALYYINVEEGILHVYTLDEEKYPGLKEFLGEKKDIYELVKSYGLSQHIHPDDRHLFNDFSAQMIREKLACQKKYSVRFRTDTGNGYRWDEMDLIKSEDVNEVPNAVAVGFADRDSEIRKEQEYQLRLEETRVAAENANNAKTNFLFSMSHDIRTPMNAITGFTNMAIKHIDDREKALDCLSKIQQSGSMLLSLINSVLEVSRIESGKAIIEEQYGDIFYSFANIEHTMRELAKTKDIDLSIEFGDIRNRFILADFSRCMRIFVNVISNAIKYTPDGGYVKVRCEQVGEAKDGYGTYKYTVSDNGIGMSEEFQKHVFEQFARENSSTVSGIQGTGLGMAVVKSFVELLGGSVSVQSKQGVGSTFTIILPFKIQEGELFVDPVTGELITSGDRVSEPEEVDFSGRRILLVEDNELNREIAMEILGEEGLLVEEAENGKKAVEMLKSKGPDYFDLVLMDIQMPIMNGYEATKAIREMYPEAKLPIIALSANAFAEDKKASIAAGMNDHVAKPIKIKELFAAMAKFL